MPDPTRATAALRDWPCTNADHLGLCSDDHVHADHVVTAATWVKARYSPATAWPAEGARVGLVTCLDCGAAIFLSMDAPALTLHDAWHERIDGLHSAVTGIHKDPATGGSP